MCRPHASEARRPEAGSRAEGVSRAERGNDGSPNGVRRRRWLNAKHDSATGRFPGRDVHIEKMVVRSRASIETDIFEVISSKPNAKSL